MRCWRPVGTNTGLGVTLTFDGGKALAHTLEATLSIVDIRRALDAAFVQTVRYCVQISHFGKSETRGLG
jgi:hypothetical protein